MEKMSLYLESVLTLENNEEQKTPDHNHTKITEIFTCIKSQRLQ